MKVVDAICEILKREGVEFLSCYPTNTLIEAAATAGIKPIVCRQERVGVGIADGFTRITNGKRIGVFTMQAGPGAENAFSGITTAYSDSVPILLLPVGHARNTSQVFHFFRSVQAYAPVTKWTEEITLANQVPEIMRRAFSYLKMGRLGPVLVEIPNDAAIEEFPGSVELYTGETNSKRRQCQRRSRSRQSFGAGKVAGHRRRPGRALRRSVGRTGRTRRAPTSARDDPARRQERVSRTSSPVSRHRRRRNAETGSYVPAKGGRGVRHRRQPDAPQHRRRADSRGKDHHSRHQRRTRHQQALCGGLSDSRRCQTGAAAVHRSGERLAR